MWIAAELMGQARSEEYRREAEAARRAAALREPRRRLVVRTPRRWMRAFSFVAGQADSRTSDDRATLAYCHRAAGQPTGGAK